MTPQVLPKGSALYCIIAGAFQRVTLLFENQACKTAALKRFVLVLSAAFSFFFYPLPPLLPRDQLKLKHSHLVKKKEVFDAILASSHCV